MRDDVVHFAGDPAALGGSREGGLLFAISCQVAGVLPEGSELPPAGSGGVAGQPGGSQGKGRKHGAAGCLRPGERIRCPADAGGG